jgi:ABC-type uncharacterized transport system ATPase subunit
MKVEFRNIHKHFGKVHANNDICLTIQSGTIQGILGENGAGKSTLMKILSGFIQADSGQILLDDQPIIVHSPADAIKHGIGMLHQDPLDVPQMNVIDNFILGQEGSLFPHHRQALKNFVEMQKKFGFTINPEAYVDTLTVGERQQLEILRLLWLGARVLILDEPTSGISASQRELLFNVLRKLAEQDMTVIFVSHKLEEIENLCGRVAVFQRGRLVGETAPPYVTSQLVAMMFGKSVTLDERICCATEEISFKLTNISTEDYRLQIQGTDLDLYKGEVIGLAGMEGSGQRLFLRALAGLHPLTKGKIQTDQIELTSRSYLAFRKAGISYLPAGRLEEGLISGLTLTEHVILTEPQSGFFVNKEKGLASAQKKIEDFFIRGTPSSKVEELSGGNQQRALLALQQDYIKLLLMEHPTRGLDIESAIWIWSKLKERCKTGTTIMFISSDLEELLQYSDRMLVFFGGKVSPPLDASTLSVEQLGHLIGGKGF